MALSQSFVRAKRSVFDLRRSAALPSKLVSHHVCRATVLLCCSGKGIFINNFRYEYLWEDGVKYKRPTKLAAPDYVDALMNWAQNILDDDTVFPNKIGLLYSLWYRLLTAKSGVPFPKNFRDTVRTIVRRLFRVYAHIYSNHFDQICALGIEGNRSLLFIPS